MKNRICIFVVPPFNPKLANGGAENICRIVCLELSKKYEIIVLHAEFDNNQPIGSITKYSDNLYSCSAFYLDEWTRDRGEVYPKFCEVAENIIRNSRLIISFERCVLGLDIPQITVLGGISYIHCKDVAKSLVWDKLVVPSFFIKKQCEKLRIDTDRIEVIYNGINCNSFSFINERLTNKALLPFRPDKGKGFFEAIDFISCVNIIKRWGEYSILVTRLDNTSFSDSEFYNEVNNYATEKNVVIEYVPWTSVNEMNALYNRADFVLALGNLEEGFGLTTIESVLAGRPVITKNIGATSEVLSSGYGTVFLESSITFESVNAIMEIINSNNMKKNLFNGANYIKEKYDIRKMLEKFDNLVDKCIFEK